MARSCSQLLRHQISQKKALPTAATMINDPAMHAQYI